MRINQYLAKAGLGSRRSVEKLISAGSIKVNGQVVRDLSTQIKSGDKVEFEGKQLGVCENVYYLVNKPVGYTCTREDIHAEKLVTELVPPVPKVFPVGRLDKDSRGLIILTNDGEFAYQISHPKFQHEKEYEVESKYLGKHENHDLEKLIRHFKCGTILGENKTAPAKIKVISKHAQTYGFRIILNEGKNRQIRRIMEKSKFQVVLLRRLRIDRFNMGDICEGDYRKINPIKS